MTKPAPTTTPLKKLTCGWCELYSPMCHSREQGHKRKPTRAEKMHTCGKCMVDDSYRGAYNLCAIPVERSGFVSRLLRAYRFEERLAEQSGSLWEGEAM